MQIHSYLYYWIYPYYWIYYSYYLISSRAVQDVMYVMIY